MNELLLGLLSALVATNQVVAASNVLAQATGIHAPVVNPQDPVEREYRQLLEADDEAQEEVDAWIEAASSQSGPADDLAAITLNARIKQRFESVEKGYQDFLRRHPKHTRARLAYGSMLSDFGRHDEAVAQWEKARELEPTNPATWNNLADHFSHFGPARKSLEYFAKAVELSPQTPLYRYNLATAVFVFRADALELYGLADDQAVLRKALDLYRAAFALVPNDFKTATDLAQVYYYLQPAAAPDAAGQAKAREQFLAEAIAAWRQAERLATDELEREGVAIHMARLCGMHGEFAQGRQHLERVRHAGLAEVKTRVRQSLDLKEAQARPGPAKEATDTPGATAPGAGADA
ncbi:MAG: tetratricopeptide repeat protein [Verrucomicrobiales bacterium]|nr:tetratricopeptide repeat protein [Verrucomicrobiales bacterium]